MNTLVLPVQDHLHIKIKFPLFMDLVILYVTAIWWSEASYLCCGLLERIPINKR